MKKKGEDMPELAQSSLELLLEISRELTTTLDLNLLLQRIVLNSMQHVGAERATLIVVDAAQRPQQAAIFYNNQLQDYTLEQLQSLLDQGLAGWVMRNRQPALLPDTSQDERWLARPYEITDRTAAKSAVCVPLIISDQLVGVLTIIHSQPGSFNQSHLSLLQIIAGQAAIAIRNAQLYSSLQSATLRYRELFEDSVDPIFITGLDGTILEANRRAIQVTGFMEGQLTQRSILELHEIKWDLLGRNFEQLLPGKTVTYESMLILADGRKLPVEVYARRVAADNQEYLQWLVRDLTERKTLDAMRNDLSAMIYHDLRSPLSNIISSLDMLSAMLPMDENPSLASVFSIAHRSADRLQRLISSLLDINRLEAGQSIIRPRACAPHELVMDARETVLPLLEAREQSLKVDLPANLPSVWVDADMIRRVLVNLMENATKFTPLHGVISVGGRLENGWVTMWVEDTGPGIPADAREYIFEKFARLHGERFPKGLGLGLAFCRLAVQAHGGKIWVECPPDVGSRFLFTLPVVKNSENNPEE